MKLDEFIKLLTQLQEEVGGDSLVHCSTKLEQWTKLSPTQRSPNYDPVKQVRLSRHKWIQKEEGWMDSDDGQWELVECPIYLIVE